MDKKSDFNKKINQRKRDLIKTFPVEFFDLYKSDPLSKLIGDRIVTGDLTKEEAIVVLLKGIIDYRKKIESIIINTEIKEDETTKKI